MKSPHWPRTAIAALLLCGLCNAWATQDTIDMNNLTESQVVLVDASKAGNPGKSFIAATVINAPMQKLCAIVLNFSDYPSFMPNTESAIATQAADKSFLVDMSLKLPLGKTKKYRLKMESRTSPQACQLSWKQVPWEGLKPEETIADTSGYWLLTPSIPDKNKTAVKYFVYTDPGPVPAGLGWIVDSLSKDSLPKTLEALRKKAQAR
jgi:hypothetical protein